MSSTTTGLTDLMSTFYDKKFLERAKETMVYDIGAVVKKLSLNSGKTIKWNRMSPLAKATTPLTEATNPSAVDMTTTAVTAAVAEYGNYTKVGTLFALTSIDEDLKEHVSVHGQNAGETIDELIANELDGGGTDQFAGGNTAITDMIATDVLDGAEIRKAVRTLFLNKAPKFENNHYRAIIPASCVYDLRGDNEWLDAHRYTNAEMIKNGMVGRLHGVEFFETNNEVVSADAGSGNVDIYTTFVFGQYAYGIVDLEGQMGPRIYVKTPNSGSTENPLDLYSTVGWKAHFAVKVLNADWLIELQAASSVGANS